MNLDDLFGMDDEAIAYTVATWQYNGPNRVTMPGGQWETLEDALLAAEEWTGVPLHDFNEQHTGTNRDTLASLAYKQKVGLVVICQGDTVIRTAPLDGQWMPGGV